MKFRTTLLLLLALALLSAAYWGMKARGRRAVEQTAEASRLFAFQAGDVRLLTIAQINQPAVTGERDSGGVWRITAPDASIPPLQELWDRVAERLSVMRSQRTVSDTVGNPAEYGLDVPALTVTVDAGGRGPPRSFSAMWSRPSGTGTRAWTTGRSSSWTPASSSR